MSISNKRSPRSISKHENQILGDYDLSSMDISNMNIPAERIRLLPNSAGSSAGVLKKFNIQHSSMGLLYVKSGMNKGNSTRYDIHPPIVERICYEIGELLGFNMVPYGLWVIDSHLFDLSEDVVRDSYEPENISLSGKSFASTLQFSGKVLVSVSQSFLGESHAFESAKKTFVGVASKDLYKEILIFGAERLEEVRSDLDKMILFDFIVNNTDRHLGNFGFIYDADMDIRFFAPLFDHGLSLCSGFDDSEIEEDGMELCLATMGKPFGSLQSSLNKYVDKDSFLDINKEVSVEDLWQIVDKYSPVLRPARVNLMKRILEVRWNYVRKHFLS